MKKNSKVCVYKVQHREYETLKDQKKKESLNKMSEKTRTEKKRRKQEEKILNEPAASYRLNDIVVVIISGLICGL